jgi:ribosomal protein L30E
VERKKAKCVIVTPNIERISSPEGGLFEAVEAIVRTSQQNRITVIFAMTRTSLGKAISKRLKVAALAILDPSGTDLHHTQAFSTLLHYITLRTLHTHGLRTLAASR